MIHDPHHRTIIDILVTIGLTAAAAIGASLGGCAPMSQQPTTPAAAAPSRNDDASRIVLGLGANQPLERAVTQIMPAEWTYQLEPGVPKDLRVSWSGGRPWMEVLNDTLTPVDLVGKQLGPHHIVISTKQQLAAAAPSSPPQPPSRPGPAVPPAPAASSPAPATAAATPFTPSPLPTPTPPATAQAQSPGKSPAKPASPIQLASLDTSAAPAAPLPLERWTVVQGDTLRGAATEWARRAGWTLDWVNPLRDYQIDAPAQFEGEFTDALQHLVEAFAGYQPRVKADVYPRNRAVVINITGDADN